MTEQKKPVYAVGTLGYDFGSEARRDSFKQQMGTDSNPYDPEQMTAHLRERPGEAEALMWTLDLDRTPIYCLEPSGGDAGQTYAKFVELLGGQLLVETGEESAPGLLTQAYEEVSGFLLGSSGSERDRGEMRGEVTGTERVAVAGTLDDRPVKLFSGQAVPTVEVASASEVVGWQVMSRTLEAAGAERQDEREAIGGSVKSFLERLFPQVRNLGTDPADRALNYGLTAELADGVPDLLAQGKDLTPELNVDSSDSQAGNELWNVHLRVKGPAQGDVYDFHRVVDVAGNPPKEPADLPTGSKA
jgi:PatG Domain